ncbi:hypothetical protein EMIT0210MI2_11225 [Priestia megaterium]
MHWPFSFTITNLMSFLLELEINEANYELLASCLPVQRLKNEPIILYTK